MATSTPSVTLTPAAEQQPQQQTQKDNWDSTTYSQNVAPFVPALTSKVVALLDPQPSDHILDLGCGDGVLTVALAPRCASIVGIDSSLNMITAAVKSYSAPNTTYIPIDALSVTSPSTRSTLLGHLPKDSPRFTKIFSNAALHWILRPLAPPPKGDLSPIVTFYKSLYACLAPGGTLATESGALGNVPEVHAALISALIHQGIPAAEAREASPWFFPSPGLMRKVLESAGFIVEVCESELRQTDMVGDDVEGWVRLFGEVFLDKVGKWAEARGEDPSAARERVVKEVVEVVEGVGRRVEDGGFVLGYVRLRVLARKPTGSE